MAEAAGSPSMADICVTCGISPATHEVVAASARDGVLTIGARRPVASDRF